MRHERSGRKLGRNSPHRRAMYRNMVTSLLEHERIRTTEAKAKELRRFAERTITKAMRVLPLMEKKKRSKEDGAKIVHAMRMAGRLIRSREIIHKLFNEIAPKLKGRPGGYTRILRVGRRVGDAAPMVLIELVSREAPKADEADAA